MRRLHWIGAILLVTLALFTTACQQSDDTITIGYLGPLSGDFAEYGTDERTAIEIAVDEINANGGVNGKNLSVIYEDGKCTGKAAATAARKLVNTHQVDVILGGACSGETLAAKPIAEQSETVLITAFSTDPTVTENANYTFRAGINDEQGGQALAGLVRASHEDVAMLTENTDYGVSLENVFTESFEQSDGSVYSQRYQQGADDFRSQLTKIQEERPEAVVFNPQSGKTGGQAMKQAREMGLDQPFYGTFFVSGNSFNSIYGNRSVVRFVDAPSVSEEDPGAAALLREFEDRAGREPSNIFVMTARYDAVHMVADAIRQVGYDGPAIKDRLYDMRYDGVLDTYRFNEEGEAPDIQYVAYKYENGTVERLQ